MDRFPKSIPVRLLPRSGECRDHRDDPLPLQLVRDCHLLTLPLSQRLAVHHPPALDDLPDPARVADVLERIGVEHHEIGDPALGDRANPMTEA
jgi:hypothetical protein